MMRLIVDTQGSVLHKSGDRLTVERNGEVTQSVPLETLDQLILMGRGVQASTALLHDLVSRGVDVVYQSQAGRFSFRLAGPLSNHSALRVQQTFACQDPARALAFARPMIQTKLNNQAVVLHRQDEGNASVAMAVHAIKQHIGLAGQARDIDQLRGYEGAAAASYFRCWPALFDAAAWGFGGREYHPAPDPVNALLSLGYTLLLNEIVAAVYRIGLDPMLGFFHSIDYGRPSLALDIEEEFRPVIVDTVVLHILQHELLLPRDFRRDGPQVLMTDDARRFFLDQYEERLQVTIRHPGQRQTLTYAQCIGRQVEHLARCIAGRDAAYQPLTIG